MYKKNPFITNKKKTQTFFIFVQSFHLNIVKQKRRLFRKWKIKKIVLNYNEIRQTLIFFFFFKRQHFLIWLLQYTQTIYIYIYRFSEITFYENLWLKAKWNQIKSHKSNFCSTSTYLELLFRYFKTKSTKGFYLFSGETRYLNLENC